MTVSETPFFPTISVIVNTDGRVNSLKICLESLRYLRYPNFEVVVVAGPTRDGTHELCASYGKHIRYADCSELNLSKSRNISIQISSGEIVAFLDDDSIPEPEWLDHVVPAFRDPSVAVAGGFLHDHTGKAYQWTFGTVNRFGVADQTWTRPAPEFNFPGSFEYPHVMANSLFRRSAIVEVGGFDEEYEYFLDETDLIVRFVDAGWKVAQLDRGFIHHKFMSSHLRNESRILTSWFSVLKNKTYFTLMNGAGHASVSDVLHQTQATVSEFRAHVNWAIGEGFLEPERIHVFEDEVDRALRIGLARGLRGERSLCTRETLEGKPGFTIFEPLLSGEDQRCYVLLTSTYPPASIGGIGRFVHHLAREIASQGHQVHVLTVGEGHDRVDFEENVWVHRLCIREFPIEGGMVVPQARWNHARTMLDELDAVAGRRPVHAVCAPIWDIEGIAILETGRYRLFTLLQTTLATYLDANPDRRRDDPFMREFGEPVLALESRLVLEADAVLAHSEAIVEEVEEKYGIRIPHQRRKIVPLGLADWTAQPSESPAGCDSGLRVCFIGRLEARKGADVFLDIVPSLLAAHPNLHVDVVGNDRIPFEGGRPLRTRFESQHANSVDTGRVAFHGEVSEERLRGFYAAADVVVAPSRFESFGLVHLEAMMHGRTVIGCAVGGMQEIIDDGVTGLLALPGDRMSLLATVTRAISDPELRRELGGRARDAYESRFTAKTMARNMMHSMEQTLLARTVS